MELVKRIDKISIRNVKGIANGAFSVNIIPNKPTLLVAPNGFGKSSFATAFASLTKKKLELDKAAYHHEDDTLDPELRVEFTCDDASARTAVADARRNDIASVFDVFVMNSRLRPKARKLRIGGANIATASIEVEPVVLLKNAPAKVRLTYSYQSAKAAFGANGKVLPNISAFFKNDELLAALENINFAAIKGKAAKSARAEVRAILESTSGSVSAIVSSVGETIQKVCGVSPFVEIVTAMKDTNVALDGDLEYVLAALQIAELYESDAAVFKKAIKYSKFLLEKQAYELLFATLRQTWKNIAPRTDVNGDLIVEFPSANHISNGERDVISFVASLKSVELQLKKQNSIVIIDELFDYLDDGNLVACQYYVSQLIQRMRAQGRRVFPLIMTHLSPGYFRTFCFSDQKVVYLDKAPKHDKSVEDIIINREDPTIREEIDRRFLHFSPGDVDLNAEFALLGLSPLLSTASGFAAHVRSQLERYLGSKSYDPISVACGLRVLIEGLVFNRLPTTARTGFLETHGTSAKLDYARENGVTVPEIFYFLGIIYNDALHIRRGYDYASALASKLGNMTIHEMIVSCKRML